ncbi:MAG: tetratricopeptide repeat protein [Alloprevotella sp.]|nr:tetratricopeptide repeat protein [Alloprevotella sp.]
MTHRHIYILLVVLAGILAGCASVDRKEPSATPLSAEERLRYRELYTAAILAREEGDYPGAYLLLDRALRISPDEASAIYLLSIVMDVLTDTIDLSAKADSLVRRAVALAPDNYEYKEDLAQRLVSQDSTEAAIHLLEELAERRKNDEQKIAMLVSLYFHTNRYDKALLALDRLEPFADEPEVIAGGRIVAHTGMGDTLQAMRVIRDYIHAQTDTLTAKVWAGLRYLELGRKELALQEWREVEAIDPDLPQLQMAQYKYYGDNNDTEAFHNVLRRGILNPRLNERQREAFLRVCSLSLLLGDSGDGDGSGSEKQWAQSVLKEAYNRLDCDLSIARHYAAALQEQGADFDTLEPVWSRIISLCPNDSQARIQLIMGYRERGDMDAYFEMCREAQEIIPDELIFYYVEGVQRYQQGDAAAALDVLQRGVTATSDSFAYTNLTSDAYGMMGDILHELKRNDEAFAAYESALYCNPQNLLCMNNYAYFLSLEDRNMERAEELAKAAVDAEPRNTTYLDTYAWVLYVMGKTQQAHIYIEMALKYMPADDPDATVYDHAGDIAHALHEEDDARSFWKSALEHSSDAELTKKIQKKIQKELK